jgi:hypothetical protein
MTTANRFHLVPPRTWDFMRIPPSRTYISGGARGPALGWEKSYVLGKESAEASGGAMRVRITGDHPRATTMDHAFERDLISDRPRS